MRYARIPAIVTSLSGSDVESRRAYVFELPSGEIRTKTAQALALEAAPHPQETAQGQWFTHPEPSAYRSEYPVLLGLQ